MDLVKVYFSSVDCPECKVNAGPGQMNPPCCLSLRLRFLGWSCFNEEHCTVAFLLFSVKHRMEGSMYSTVD